MPKKPSNKDIKSKIKGLEFTIHKVRYLLIIFFYVLSHTMNIRSSTENNVNPIRKKYLNISKR